MSKIGNKELARVLMEKHCSTRRRKRFVDDV
jgi:hypothetical protein